jgi:hypothetical protein
LDFLFSRGVSSKISSPNSFYSYFLYS